MKFLVSALVVISYFSSCSSMVNGSDDITVVERGVASFSAVSVEDGINMVVSDTPKGNVSITANDNIIQYIKTTVDNGTLHINIKRGVNLRNVTLSVAVSGYGLNSISASGGSAVEVNRSYFGEHMRIDLSGGSQLHGVMDVQTLDAEISGGANLRIQGLPAKSIKLESSGGSRAELAVEARDVDLDISGGGKTYVWVSDVLNVKLSGGSSVFYKGAGHIGTIESSGGSSISPQDWK